MNFLAGVIARHIFLVLGAGFISSAIYVVCRHFGMGEDGKTAALMVFSGIVLVFLYARTPD
jgi:hypothetical protein